MARWLARPSWTDTRLGRHRLGRHRREEPRRARPRHPGRRPRGLAGAAPVLRGGPGRPTRPRRHRRQVLGRRARGLCGRPAAAPVLRARPQGRRDGHGHRRRPGQAARAADRDRRQRRRPGARPHLVVPLAHRGQRVHADRRRGAPAPARCRRDRGRRELRAPTREVLRAHGRVPGQQAAPPDARVGAGLLLPDVAPARG